MKRFFYGSRRYQPKQEAHKLIERISTAQASAVVALITSMLDPVDRAIANAPHVDEPVSDEEARDIAEGLSSCARGEAVSHDEVLAEFGPTNDDLDRVGQTPLEADRATPVFHSI